MTQALLPLLRKARGRVVFVSSIGGLVALPFNGPYHASKWGLKAIGDSLRQELQPFGMEVGSSSRGRWRRRSGTRGTPARTRYLDGVDPEALGLYEKRLAGFRGLAREAADRGVDPDEIAAIIETALTTERPRTRYLIGRDAKMRVRVRRRSRIASSTGWSPASSRRRTSARPSQAAR